MAKKRWRPIAAIVLISSMAIVIRVILQRWLGFDASQASIAYWLFLGGVFVGVGLDLRRR